MSSVESSSPPGTPDPDLIGDSLQPRPPNSLPPLQRQHISSWADSATIDLEQAGSSTRSRHTPSYAARNHRQTLAEFLQDGQPVFIPQALSPEERRQSMVAMDRKRRLTSSTNDGQGRRPAHGFPESPRHMQPPSPVRRTTSGNDIDPSREVIDLTLPSPEMAARTQPRRPSRNLSNQYIMPRWQPDAEVSECPICHRAFTWMFRRHHCRKCGRVVCNDCSPHRITIPRQYIVQPPGFEEFPSISHPTPHNQTATIDLTGDDEAGSDSSDDDHAEAHHHVLYRRPSSSVNPALGGGEKVRLCNPCVPDPQPISHSNYPVQVGAEQQVQPSQNRMKSTTSTDSTSLRGMPHTLYLTQPVQPSRPRAASHHDQMHSSGSLAWRNSMPRPGMQSSASAQSRLQAEHPSRQHQGPPQPSPHMSRRDYPMPPVPGSMPRQFGASGITLPAYGHGRYHSLNAPGRPPSHWSMHAGTGSSVDRATLQRFVQEASAPRLGPRLREEDICPVCRRALPARGAHGDETAREAHIMECISAREPSSAVRQAGAGPSASVVGIVSFIANEKDCVGEDGNRQECSICMVEYDVGDSLARLECWCKFHRECIVEWFTRKQECPVHRLHE